jgi:hypothetical protein
MFALGWRVWVPKKQLFHEFYDFKDGLPVEIDVFRLGALNRSLLKGCWVHCLYV